MTSDKTALVAGGAGFIGSHLVERLLGEGAKVVVLDNLQTGRLVNLAHLRTKAGLKIVTADVIDDLPPEVSNTRFTHIYNLACAASPPHYQVDPEHTMLTNVVGTRNLLRLAERTGARFLQTSTSEVYGDPEVHPQREEYRGWVSCTGPRACYDEGKRAAEALIFDFDRLGRADVRVVRIFNTYGPRMDPCDGRVVSNVICQAISGNPLTIYGDGSQTRSFCYVDDLVDGIERLMAFEGPQPGPVNLGNPNELTVSDLVERVLALAGSGNEVAYLPLPTDDPRRRKPDISLAASLLGWEPRVDLQAGLEATMSYFQQELSDEATRAAHQQQQPTLAAAE
ncbi:SDR family oxidoreductase [Sphingomonas ginkgonis]|uniref:SDR family oxidoreductase n=1 Tax=Sphingomonas ginkgonis TaxID=2315330 RepID=A0A429V6E5_9SPHN|nr:UDP-glucuronic acid decarboxylase family protein [Sphingomonas ginkgonis]RST29510.1 SDR family oxidoreductase [Sphingomonas ginkgonis]